jgi:RHS repeat-associated protein
VTIARYGYTTSGDSPDLILDAGGGVMERTFVFLGQVLLTKRGAGDAVWSYPNIHGDVTATTDGTGTQTGSFSYDPYGQALGALPDNATDNLDYGWLGQHQRPLEHEGTLATIEMGDRQYIPGLGRFIEVDPVEGGNDNPYEYCSADPINCTDLDGQLSLKKLVKKIRTVARVVALVPGPIGTVAGGVAAGASLAIGDWNGLATDAAFMAAGAVGGRALAQFGKTRGLAGAQQGLKGVGVNSRLFGRHNQGILNSNDVIRLGWSWRGSASNGYNSFGLRLGSKRGPIHWHFPIV